MDSQIPKQTETIPITTAIDAILFGDLDHCRAAAAGIIIKAINNKIPIIAKLYYHIITESKSPITYLYFLLFFIIL